MGFSSRFRVKGLGLAGPSVFAGLGDIGFTEVSVRVQVTRTVRSLGSNHL